MLSSPAANLLKMLALGAMSSIASAQAQEGAPLPDPLPQLSRDDVGLLDASMEGILQRFSIPGLAVGIVEKGVPVYMRAFGVRDTKTGEPVNIHTLFRTAALTKTFTATAIMQLADRKLLGLEDPIVDSSVTLAQLLTSDDTTFDALGAVIEATSHQAYPQYLQSEVLAAAGMVESTFDMPLHGSNFAWPHTGKVFVQRAPQYPADVDSQPSVGLYASIADMTRWAAAQVNRDPSLLTPASYDAMLQHQRDSTQKDVATALGWQLERRGDSWLPAQAGTDRGFSAMLTLYPEQQRAIVILSNGETTPVKEIRKVIELVLAGQSYVPPQPSLLLRRDFQWSVGGLLAIALLLIAMNVRHRRRREPA